MTEEVAALRSAVSSVPSGMRVPHSASKVASRAIALPAAPPPMARTRPRRQLGAPSHGTVAPSHFHYT